MNGNVHFNKCWFWDGNHMKYYLFQSDLLGGGENIVEMQELEEEDFAFSKQVVCHNEN